MGEKPCTQKQKLDNTQGVTGTNAFGSPSPISLLVTVSHCRCSGHGTIPVCEDKFFCAICSELFMHLILGRTIGTSLKLES